MGLINIIREYHHQKRRLKFNRKDFANVAYKIKDLESLNSKLSRPSGKFKLIEKTQKAAKFSNNHTPNDI